MQTFEILLNRRKGKSVFYIIAAFFFVVLLAMIVVTMLDKYAWWQLLLLLIFLIGAFITIKGLYEYFFYGDVKLILESADDKIKFYNLTGSNKKFNLSREIELEKISRIYSVQKTTRFLYKNYYYEFEGKSKLSKVFKEIIEVFPPLFEASDKDRNAMLYYIKTLNPEIEIGYQSIFQKASK